MVVIIFLFSVAVVLLADCYTIYPFQGHGEDAGADPSKAKQGKSLNESPAPCRAQFEHLEIQGFLSRAPKVFFHPSLLPPNFHLHQDFFLLLWSVPWRLIYHNKLTSA